MPKAQKSATPGWMWGAIVVVSLALVGALFLLWSLGRPPADPVSPTPLPAQSSNTPGRATSSTPSAEPAQTSSATAVDIARYGSAQNWAFRSPSGKFLCGSLPGPSGYGCQARGVAVAGMEECGTNFDHKTAMVSVTGGKVERGCTTQNVFPGEQVLEYGTSITTVLQDGVQVTCSSWPTGTQCRGSDGAGFTISTEGIY